MKAFHPSLSCLNPERDLPRTFLFTDPDRLPNPLRALTALPPRSGIIVRHFGRPHYRQLVKALITRAHHLGHIVLIGRDPVLAEQLQADGVHWPERSIARAKAWRQRYPRWLHTGAAHSLRALKTAHYNQVDGVFLSPLFPSNSPSAVYSLSQADRQRAPRLTPTPILGLGGVKLEHANTLWEDRFYGWGAIEGWI